MGGQGVQQAGFSHAGVAGEDAQPAAQGLVQLGDALACGGAGPQHRDGGGAVNVVELVRTIQVALVQHHQHLAALQRGDGADAVDEVGIRHRDGGGGDDHQLIHIGGGGPLELAGAGLDGLDDPFSPAQLLDLHPVAHQGAHALLAELAPGAALDDPAAGIHIVEAAEGFLNSAPAQKLITCESVASPLIRAYTVEAVPDSPSKS